ncbi:unnamed protein product, partial [Mesorhabditis spiculigera]
MSDDDEEETQKSNGSIRKAFPSRSNSTSSSSSPGKPSVAELVAELRSVTKYTFGELVATVLKFDLLDPEDPKSLAFCKKTLQMAMNQLDLPARSQKLPTLFLEGEVELTEVATLITKIKEDPIIVREGATVLISALLTGVYDCRYRVLLRHLTTLLAVVWDEFEKIEDSMVCYLLEEPFVESEQAKKAREKTARKKKFKRYLMIGAAGGVGGVLIGLTGGLAAPLVAVGAGAVIGGAATAIGTTAGAAILGTTFGVAGAGLSGYKMKKRVGAIEEFSVEILKQGHSLNCIMAISGWVDKDSSSEQAFVYPWRHLEQSHEQYTLRYESTYLAELGQAIDYLMSFAVSVAIQQTLMETALAGLMSAVAWPVAILSCASVLDNPWNVCIARSAEVGEHLAEILLARSHGARPISLIGYSLGARVIYHCLVAMSKRADSAGIVEDVVLLGAPVSASAKQWNQMAKVVGGRIINGYCETDWLLRFVYRTMSVQFGIAGTSPVTGASKKIVNYNVSHIVKGHMDYSKKLTEVLKAVGVKVSAHSPDSISSLASMCEEATEASEGDTTVSNSHIPGPELTDEISVRDHAFHAHDESYTALR